jgi:hypothetical protein
MIRHDLQQDVKEAHRALSKARELCICSGVLNEIEKANEKVWNIADKLGIDLLTREFEEEKV